MLSLLWHSSNNELLASCGHFLLIETDVAPSCLDRAVADKVLSLNDVLRAFIEARHLCTSKVVTLYLQPIPIKEPGKRLRPLSCWLVSSARRKHDVVVLCFNVLLVLMYCVAHHFRDLNGARGALLCYQFESGKPVTILSKRGDVFKSESDCILDPEGAIKQELDEGVEFWGVFLGYFKDFIELFWLINTMWSDVSSFTLVFDPFHIDFEVKKIVQVVRKSGFAHVHRRQALTLLWGLFHVFSFDVSQVSFNVVLNKKLCCIPPGLSESFNVALVSALRVRGQVGQAV